MTMLHEQVILGCHFAGVDTKITGVGISVKSTGSVLFELFVSANYTANTSFYR